MPRDNTHSPLDVVDITIRDVNSDNLSNLRSPLGLGVSIATSTYLCLLLMKESLQ